MAGSEKICVGKIINEKQFIERLGYIKLNCFSGKSLLYCENDILLVGGISEIFIVNIKSIKLDYTICIPCECSCFLKFTFWILCGYGDTSRCYSWSRGIAH